MIIRRISSLLLTVMLMLVGGCATRPTISTVALDFPPEIMAAPTHNPGPMLRLGPVNGTSNSPIDTFMYFVPLTSPNAVTVEKSPGNSQGTRILPVVRQVSDDRFYITCDFDILGEGFLRNTFDHSQNVQRAEQTLREGGTLARQLDTITVEGSGSGTIEVEGDISNHVARVEEVRFRFNSRGKPSPVTFGVVDLSLVNGSLWATNEHLARVNTLTFRTTTNPVPRMVVSIGSIRRKDASGGIWQKFSGAFSGLAANIFLKPTRVSPEGQAAMLQFGAHLAAGRSYFVFPEAQHLTTRLDTPSKPPVNSK